MMTVMQWLAALAIVLSSLGAAVAQNTGSKPPTGPTILVPNPSSVAEPVSGGGPAPDVAAGPGHPRQPTIISSAFPDHRTAAAEVRVQCGEKGNVRCDFAAAGLDGPPQERFPSP